MSYKKIKTFEAACLISNIDSKILPDVSSLPPKFQNWLIANYKLAIITQAINTDEKGNIWEPNWNNPDEWKYYPYFWVAASEEKPSGFGFSYSRYHCTCASTDLGSRLCFDTKEKVDHVQEHFEELFKELLLIL